jgi:hypothetical protein
VQGLFREYPTVRIIAGSSPWPHQALLKAALEPP